MSKKTTQFNVRMSTSQSDIVASVCDAVGITKSELTRLALKAMIQKEYGIVWPDDMPKHGGRRPYPRTEQDN